MEAARAAYERTLGLAFGELEMMLGGAVVAELPGGGSIGIRPPLRDDEAPVTRAYALVPDIQAAVAEVEALGAEIAVPPMEIPGKGWCAIYILGGVEHGFWAL